jgi:hypothetical protein
MPGSSSENFQLQRSCVTGTASSAAEAPLSLGAMTRLSSAAETVATSCPKTTMFVSQVDR